MADKKSCAFLQQLNSDMGPNKKQEVAHSLFRSPAMSARKFIMTLSKVLDLCKKSVVAWNDDFAPSMGAAISYYTAFSLAPLLVIVIAVAGLVFGEDAVRGTVQAQIAGLVGKDGAAAVQGLIASAREPSEGLIAGSISIVLLVVGATTVFAEIQSALDRIWHVPEKAKPSGLWGLLRARFLSFGLILGLAFLLMTSLAVSAAVAAVGNWFGGLLPGWEVLLHMVNTALSLAIGSVLFAAIFKWMPSVQIAWRDVRVGAVVTACLFEAGKLLIGLYIGKAGVSSSYAAAGSIAVVLIWVYYAAQIFLLGAEFTKVYASEHGALLHGKAATAKVEAPLPTPTPVPSGPAPAAHPVHKAPEGAAVLGFVLPGALFVAKMVLRGWIRQRNKKTRGIHSAS
jgi:membrane protein